jgi:hypothetical protein
MIAPTFLAEESPLTRSVDFAHRSNVLVVVFSIMVAVARGIYSRFAGEPPPTPWRAVGVGAFIAWAIAREIDPDHNISAAVATIVSGMVGVAVVRVPSGSATTVVPRIESWLSNA